MSPPATQKKDRRVAVAAPAPIAVEPWEQRVIDRSLHKATQRSLERASGLMDAAIRLMAETKGDTFTVQDVAVEAGQSLRSFYQHFSNKDDLLLAVFEKVMRVYAELLREYVEKYDDAFDRLVAAVVSVARLTRRTSYGMVVVLSRLRMQLMETNPETVADSIRPVSEMLREVVTAAVEANVVGACDPDSVVFALLSLSAAVTESQFLGNAVDAQLPDDRQLVRFCLQGMNAELPKGYLERFGISEG